MAKRRGSVEDDPESVPIIFEISGEFGGHSTSITSIGVAKDSTNSVITGSIDGTLILWDLPQTREFFNDNYHTIIKGKINKSLPCHNSHPIQSVDIDCKGKYAVTASNDSTIKAWNLLNGELLNTFKGHQQEITSISLSQSYSPLLSHSNYIASSGIDQKVIIWNTNSGEQVLKMEYDSIVHQVLFSSNNQYLIVASVGIIRIYKLYSDNHISNNLKHTTYKLKGHRGARYRMAISPDNSVLATADEFGKVKCHQLNDAKLICEFNSDGSIQETINDICFAQSKYWICAATNSCIFIWDLLRKKKLITIDFAKALSITKNPGLDADNVEIEGNRNINSMKINCIYFPSGSTIFAGCNDGILRAASIVNDQQHETVQIKKQIVCKYGNQCKYYQQGNCQYFHHEQAPNNGNPNDDEKNEYKTRSKRNRNKTWKKKKDHKIAITADELCQINQTLMFDLEQEKKKNEDLEKTISSMKKQINFYEFQKKQIQQQLNDYDKVKVETKTLRSELMRKNQDYENLSAQYVDLARKHQQMSSMINYKLWQFDNIIDWICSLDDGQYQVYAHALHKNLKTENIKGIHLKELSKSDLHRLGITDFSHKKAIIKYIKALTLTKTVNVKQSDGKQSNLNSKSKQNKSRSEIKSKDKKEGILI